MDDERRKEVLSVLHEFGIDDPDKVRRFLDRGIREQEASDQMWLYAKRFTIGIILTAIAAGVWAGIQAVFTLEVLNVGKD